jgi:hypothetical protein
VWFIGPYSMLFAFVLAGFALRLRHLAPEMTKA